MVQRNNVERSEIIKCSNFRVPEQIINVLLITDPAKKNQIITSNVPKTDHFPIKLSKRMNMRTN